jgi:uncharacterized membrane protein YdbT with pleckstrin-like domain
LRINFPRGGVMSYVETILEPGEQLRYRAKISWTIYFMSISLAVLAFVVWWISFKYFDHGYTGEIGAGAILIAAFLSFIPAWLRRRGTEIAVTDRRVILRRGLIWRRTVEMNMQKIESVDVDQTIPGRLFDYGEVTIRGVDSTFERLSAIDAPFKLRSTLTAG